MKKMLMDVLLTLVVLVALLTAIGLALPRERAFTTNAVLRAERPRVFEVVTDFKHQAAWRNDVKEIRVLDATSWTEVPQRGPALSFRVKRKIENEAFEIEIVAPETSKGYWVGTFAPSGQNGTRVEFKEVVVVSNPLLRALSFLFVDLDDTMNLYLHNLKKHLGE